MKALASRPALSQLAVRKAKQPWFPRLKTVFCLWYNQLYQPKEIITFGSFILCYLERAKDMSLTGLLLKCLGARNSIQDSRDGRAPADWASRSMHSKKLGSGIEAGLEPRPSHLWYRCLRWQLGCCARHPLKASFAVGSMWGYFGKVTGKWNSLFHELFEDSLHSVFTAQDCSSLL